MKSSFLSALALGAFSLSALAGGAVAHAQTPPTRFYGTLSINGAVAPSGTTVTAYVNGNACGSVTTSDEGRYVLDAISSGTQEGCGNDGDAVTFQIGDGTAEQLGTFGTGNFALLDLSVGGGPAATSEVPPPPSTDTPPPSDAPPADAPPADAPPSDAPPADAPPVDAPPVDAPPADAPSEG